MATSQRLSLTQHENALFSQLDFMRDKLMETKDMLEDMPVAYPQKSTQGETVLKKNAMYTGYTELLGSYCKTLREVRELGAGKPEPEGKLMRYEQFAKTMRRNA